MEEAKLPEQSSETTQNQTTPPPVPTQPQPFLKFNRTILIALIAVILLIAAALGYWYVISSNQGKTVQTIRPTATPTPDPTANPDLIGANWKIYTNSDFNISFRYPLDWKISTNPLTTNITEIIISAPDDGEVASPPEVIPSALYRREIVVKVLNENKSLTIADLRNVIKDISTSAIIEEVKIDNKAALKIKNLPGGGITEVWLYNNQKQYQISHIEAVEINNVDNPKYSEIFDQILSTFKFTELIDTSSWKKYENKRLGIAFRYPTEWQDIEESGDLCENIQTKESYQCQDGLRMLSRKTKTGSIFLSVFIPTDESGFGRGGFWADNARAVDSEDYIKNYCQNNKTNSCITYKNSNNILVTKSKEDIGYNRVATLYYIKANRPEIKGIVISADDIKDDYPAAEEAIETMVNDLQFLD